MKISFILPPISTKPIGGYKIVFQYANQLVEMGHEVNLCFLNTVYPEKSSILRKTLVFCKHLFDKNSTINWFSLDSRVKIHNKIVLNSEIPRSDIVVATAAQTAFWVAKLNNKLGKKVYFIQGYETWAYSEKILIETFQLKMKKVVIAEWLRDKIKRYTSDDISVVPNFLDGTVYNFKQEVSGRENVVAMLYHVSKLKNIDFGIDVLREVKKAIPDLQVKLFGAYEKPQGLPEYMLYFQNPSQDFLRDHIYGDAKIYLLPSLSEGWGLTGMEAMATGAVLVSSNIEGVREYAVNQQNSFLITPNEKSSFYNMIISVLASEEIRVRVANKGIEDIKKYSLYSSAQKFEKIFFKLIEEKE